MDLHGESGADVSADLAEHVADTTDVHGIPDTSVLATDADVAAAVAASEAGQVRDGDAAGGVLSGTYPNPGLAADMATQAELDAHINDATAAHPASAISVDSTNLDGTGTDLQTVLEELEDQIDAGGGGTALTVMEEGVAVDVTVAVLDFDGDDFDVSESPEDEANIAISANIARQADLDAHINDATAAHPASAVSVDSTNLDGTGTDLQTVLEELEDQIDAGGGGVTPDDENLILHMEVFA